MTWIDLLMLLLYEKVAGSGSTAQTALSWGLHEVESGLSLAGCGTQTPNRPDQVTLPGRGDHDHPDELTGHGIRHVWGIHRLMITPRRYHDASSLSFNRR